MHYPGLSIKDEASTPLEELLAVDIARTELTIGDHEEFGCAPGVLKVSKQLGSACLERRFKSYDKAESLIDLAEGLTQKIAPTLSRLEQHRLEQQKALYDISGSNGDFAHNRITRYETTMHSIQRSITEVFRPIKETERTDWFGFLNEETTIALINRLCHPWIAAIRAPIHHDMRRYDRRQNYDVLVAVSSPEEGSSRTARLQVKSRKDKNEQSYDEDIKIIYANLLYDHWINGEKARLKTAILLQKEFQGKASPEEIEQLDAITRELIWDL